jgi:hypothetical protein
MLVCCDDLDGLPDNMPIIFEENYIPAHSYSNATSKSSVNNNFILSLLNNTSSTNTTSSVTRGSTTSRSDSLNSKKSGVRKNSHSSSAENSTASSNSNSNNTNAEMSSQVHLDLNTILT